MKKSKTLPGIILLTFAAAISLTIRNSIRIAPGLKPRAIYKLWFSIGFSCRKPFFWPVIVIEIDFGAPAGIPFGPGVVVGVAP